MHFVFVDFENVPGLELSALADHPVTVTLVLGKKSRLKADLVGQIASLPFEVRLIKVGVTRKNALDFVLTFHLGETMARHPAGRFYIVSKDKKDFEPVVTHLRENHLEVSRHDDIRSLPFLSAAAATVEPVGPKTGAITKKPGVSPRAKVIALLKNPATPNRPRTRRGLPGYIKTNWGKTATDVDADSVIQELIETAALSIEASNRVKYAVSASS